MSTRIGFVDYNPDNFHANIFLKILREDLSDRGFTVSGCHALLDSEGKEWSSENEVSYFESPDDLNANVDVFAVLAPSNPEVHMELCEKVLKYGKPTYVDKTFAPSLEIAEQIFGLADQHGTAIQTTSALRYTEVQEFVTENGGREALRHMIAWGPGRSFEEYAIHPAETVVSCMGEDALSLMRRNDGDFSQLIINYSDSRTAVINVCTNSKTAYAASLGTRLKTQKLAYECFSYRLVPNGLVESFGRLLMRRLAALECFDLASHDVIEYSATVQVLKLMDKFNVTFWFTTVCNGWCASYRLHEPVLLP